ncbi:hypothetical protein GCM10025734_36820 [Kitasatospora paranensis]
MAFRVYDPVPTDRTGCAESITGPGRRRTGASPDRAFRPGSVSPAFPPAGDSATYADSARFHAQSAPERSDGEWLSSLGNTRIGPAPPALMPVPRLFGAAIRDKNGQADNAA